MITIEEKDAKYLLGIFSDRLQNKSLKYHKGKSVEDVNTIDSNSKIYVMPNCRIKKLPLRKWIKHIGATQVFKPEDANCIILKKNITSNSMYNSAPFEIIQWWEVPAGEYFSERKNQIERKYIDDIWLEEDQMIAFMFQVYYARESYDNMHDHEREAIENRLRDHWKSEWKVNCIHKQMGESHMRALCDRSITLVNEIDLQQVVYDWEVKADVRDDLVVYNWDNLYQLLCSETTWSTAIMMIKKGNVESMLSKLVACFYDPNLGRDTKVALYDKLFIRKPDLRACINRRDAHQGIVYTGDIRKLFENAKEANQVLDPKPFADILNILVVDKGDSIFVDNIKP